MGPVLFLAYINVLAKLHVSEETRLILYADDLVLIKPLYQEDSITSLQEDIDKIAACIDQLQLALNVNKTQFVVISLAHATGRHHIKLTLNGEEIIQVQAYRYLGVEIDENFNFGAQAYKAALKTKQGIGAISRQIRKWATSEVLSKAITIIAIPALLYGIEIWFPPGDKHQRIVERVNKYAAIDRLATRSTVPLAMRIC